MSTCAPFGVNHERHGYPVVERETLILAMSRDRHDHGTGTIFNVVHPQFIDLRGKRSPVGCRKTWCTAGKENEKGGGGSQQSNTAERSHCAMFKAALNQPCSRYTGRDLNSVIYIQAG